MEDTKRKKLIKSEVIALFNTSKETLRHYENVGILKPEIDDKNYRYYGIEDMKRLRQIFLFRDLGISIEQMKALFEGTTTKDAYEALITSHHQRLSAKIEHLQEVKNHVEQLMELLKENEFNLSFRLQARETRDYLTFNPFESMLLDSLKAYYDEFRPVIDTPFYTERSMLSMFSYQGLDDFDMKASKMCVQVATDHIKAFEDSKIFEPLSLSKGMYLSVFYLFREGQFESLKSLKGQIDVFLRDSGLSVTDDLVLEIEHPELSVFLDPGCMLYELQLKVGETDEKSRL